MRSNDLKNNLNLIKKLATKILLLERRYSINENIKQTEIIENIKKSIEKEVK